MQIVYNIKYYKNFQGEHILRIEVDNGKTTRRFTNPFLILYGKKQQNKWAIYFILYMNRFSYTYIWK